MPVLPRVKHEVFDIAKWAESQNVIVANPQQIKTVTGKLAAGMQVKMLSLVEIAGNIPKNISYTSAPTEADIFFTVYDFTASSPNALRLVPPVLSLGIGCRKGLSCEQIEKTVFEVFEASHIHFSSVSKVCSTDLKGNEPGLVEFCKKYGLRFETYTLRQLAAARGNCRRDEYVSRTAGIDNVCERAAVLGVGETAMMLIQKTAKNGVAIAAAANTDLIEHYHFPK